MSIEHDLQAALNRTRDGEQWARGELRKAEQRIRELEIELRKARGDG